MTIERINDKIKPCKYCARYGHTAFSCPHKPRATLRTYKPMAKMGRVGKATAKAVAEWKKDQKPNHRGNYVCYICGREVPYLMAEHVKSKVRHPELRTDLNNLKPACAECNASKGSNNN